MTRQEVMEFKIGWAILASNASKAVFLMSWDYPLDLFIKR